MKKGFYFLALAVLFHRNSFAQSTSTQKTEEYCDMFFVEDFLSTKGTISIEFGNETRKPNEMLKDAQGKQMIFNSRVDALNYLNSLGWELMCL